MAFLICNPYSASLVMETQVCVMLPHDSRSGLIREPAKVVYLLHGVKEGSMGWPKRSTVMSLAEKYNVAVVMPEVQRSFYADMRYGLRYFTYTAYELPELCETMFNISSRREDTYIAGLSMGGYGALKIGMNRPDKFGHIASFSGVCDLRANIRPDMDPNIRRDLVAAFGEQLEIPDDQDNVWLSQQIAKLPAAQQPSIYQTCGTEDPLIGNNRSFRDHMQGLGLADYAYEEWPGIHKWPFWEQSIHKTFARWFGE